jgi:hypothetical protein
MACPALKAIISAARNIEILNLDLLILTSGGK